jgi:hypothetical protein
MPETPVDVYADQIAVNLGPFGSTLNFGVSLAVPPVGGGAAGNPVATVRMSPST